MIPMGIVTFILGLLLIGTGFLAKAFPGLISGYNTLSGKQKENVDIQGLSTFMKKGFIAMGLAIIAGSHIFNLLGLSFIANSTVIIVVFSGVLFILVKSRRFDHNKPAKKTRIEYRVISAIFLFIAGVLIYGIIPTKIIIDQQSIQIKGMYGMDIPISDISKITLKDNIPAITIRTNGFSVGSISKGYYNLAELGNCKLYLHSGNGPYIIILLRNGDKIIINRGTKAKTLEDFNAMKVL